MKNKKWLITRLDEETNSVDRLILEGDEEYVRDFLQAQLDSVTGWNGWERNEPVEEIVGRLRCSAWFFEEDKRTYRVEYEAILLENISTEPLAEGFVPLQRKEYGFVLPDGSLFTMFNRILTFDTEDKAKQCISLWKDQGYEIPDLRVEQIA